MHGIKLEPFNQDEELWPSSKALDVASGCTSLSTTILPIATSSNPQSDAVASMIAKLVFSQCLESLVARIEKLVLSPPQTMVDIDAIAQCAEALHPVYFALNTMGDCPITTVKRLLEACLTAELIFADIAVQVFYNT